MCSKSWNSWKCHSRDSEADFSGAVINAVTCVLGPVVAISTVCNLAGYGFMQTDEGLYFGTIQQTRMRYQLDRETARARIVRSARCKSALDAGRREY